MRDRIPPVSDGERESRCLPLGHVEVRAAADGSITVSGYAAVFDSPSEDLGGWREVIKRGAFRKVLGDDPDVRLLINHEGMPLARTKPGTLRLKEDTRGLKIEADLPDTQEARDLGTLLERGDVDQMSFRFMLALEGREWFFPEDPEELPTRIIREFSELYDVSVVTFPAYPATEVGVRGIVCGEPIANEDGRLSRDLFDAVCARVDGGELDASDADRRELDRAAEKLQTVTPWQRERALRATGNEPEGDGATADVPGGAEDRDDEAEGESYGLAARRRRLAGLEREFEFDRQ